MDDVALVRAANPSPLTLSGTNTWLVGRDPCWVVDPGPALPEHVEAVRVAAVGRGGVGGFGLPHSHADHTDGVADVAAATGDPPVAGGLGDGDTIGPFGVIATPGHA